MPHRDHRGTTFFGPIQGVLTDDANWREAYRHRSGATVLIRQQQIPIDRIALPDQDLPVQLREHPNTLSIAEGAGSMELRPAVVDEGLEERECFDVLQRDIPTADQAESDRFLLRI